uniref:Uncharacterized protein n=1 Tax=Sphaerodactylus townsendi TaxID=933632 RepID=A0ACB8E8D8_9SAUR
MLTEPASITMSHHRCSTSSGLMKQTNQPNGPSCVHRSILQLAGSTRLGVTFLRHCYSSSYAAGDLRVGESPAKSRYEVRPWIVQKLGLKALYSAMTLLTHLGAPSRGKHIYEQLEFQAHKQHLSLYILWKIQ